MEITKASICGSLWSFLPNFGVFPYDSSVNGWRMGDRGSCPSSTASALAAVRGGLSAIFFGANWDGFFDHVPGIGCVKAETLADQTRVERRIQRRCPFGQPS